MVRKAELGGRRRLALLQVQRDQQDAQQFWLALLDAVRDSSAVTGRAGPPAATPDFNAQAMVDRVLAELAGASAGVTLVIDDLHELNSPAALTGLTRLLTSLPPDVHALLTTRHDLRLGLHQLRLAGELAEIRAADLRFTERETRLLLDASGIALSESGAALLHQRTEGWAAGLRLAAISLAGHPDPERFVAEFSGSDRTVAEYLIAETLERQPADVQDLLLRTSLLEQVNGELALVRAEGDLVHGRLAEAAAHLSVAETYAATAPPDRRRRQVAIASQRLSLARRRGHLAGVLEQVRFLASPVTGQSDEDIALGSGFASKIQPFATTQLRCREAIALAERHGWGAEPVISPALITLAGTLVWLGEFDEAERWVQRTALALQTDNGPIMSLVLHHTTAVLHACRGRLREALEGSHALASQVTGWLLATQARLGRPGEARAGLAALDDERAGSGEILNARAPICLAEDDPAGALGAVQPVLDGAAPVVGYVTVLEAHLLAGLAQRELGNPRAANQAAERALALAEADRLVLPFAMTFSAPLLEALPRHQTAHAALLAGVLDVLHGASPGSGRQRPPLLEVEELSPGELRVLRYLPTNLSRPEIAGELSVSVNTVSTHVRRIYAKLQVRDRSAAVQRARELRLLAAGRTR